MVNTYLMLAYAFVWLIFMLYAWNLSRRQARLRRELEDLKSRLPGQTSSSRLSS
jgi:CcmD family protein